jgi:hypothetical protein
MHRLTIIARRLESCPKAVAGLTRSSLPELAAFCSRSSTVFGGLEITDNGITQVKSVLPANWKKLTLKGIGVDRRNYEVVNH